MTVQQELVQLSKVCSRCGEEKLFSEFYKNKASKDGYKAHCKNCSKKEKEAHKRKIYEEVFFYLIEHPCENCGESNPLLLEFDHIEKTNKFKDIGSMCAGGYGLNSILEEISKCRVLCKHCHQLKTHEENNSIPWQIYQECK